MAPVFHEHEDGFFFAFFFLGGTLAVTGPPRLFAAVNGAGTIGQPAPSLPSRDSRGCLPDLPSHPLLPSLIGMRRTGTESLGACDHRQHSRELREAVPGEDVPSCRGSVALEGGVGWGGERVFLG